MKWRCQGYRGMDRYKGEFTVEAETYEEAERKAWREHPFADVIEIERFNGERSEKIHKG